jgi:hypothetical protein
MSETLFQQQNNAQNSGYNWGLLPSEVTWNEMNQLPATTIEQPAGNGPQPVVPPTDPAPISGSIVPLLVMVAGLFMLKITRRKPANTSNRI